MELLDVVFKPPPPKPLSPRSDECPDLDVALRDQIREAVRNKERKMGVVFPDEVPSVPFRPPRAVVHCRMFSKAVFLVVCPALLLYCLYRWRAQGCHKVPFVSELQNGETAWLAQFTIQLSAVSFLVLHVTAAAIRVIAANAAVLSPEPPRKQYANVVAAPSDLERRLLVFRLCMTTSWLCVRFLAAFVMVGALLFLSAFPWHTHLEKHVPVVTVFFGATFAFFCVQAVGDGVAFIAATGKFATAKESARTLFLVSKQAMLLGIVLATFQHLQASIDDVQQCTSYLGGGIRVAQRTVTQDFRKGCLLPLLVGCEPLRQMTLAQYCILTSVWLHTAIFI